MTGDGPTDHQEDLGADASQDRIQASSIEARRGAINRRKLGLKVITYAGGMLAAIIAIAGLLHLFSSDPAPVAQSKVSPPSTVYEPPGAPGMDPALIEAYEAANRQRRSVAQENKGSFVETPIFKPSAPAPVPIETGAPAQAPVAAAEVTPSYTIGADDPRRKAMRDAILGTIEKSTKTRGVGGSFKAEQVGADGATPIQTGGQNAINKVSAPSEKGNTSEPEVIAEPHEAYGIVQNEGNSDAIESVEIELTGGVLAGSKVYGTPKVNQKTMSLHLSRLRYQGQDYTIDAIAESTDTRSPSLPVEVENHYGERILLPGFAAFVAAAGNAVAKPSTNITINSTSATSESSKLSLAQDAAAGLGGAGTAASSVINSEASAIKPTERLLANQPVVVHFLRGVTTADRKVNGAS